MKSVSRYEAELLRRAQRKEFYRRNFEAFAREQIKIRGTGPGQIFNLDIRKRPAQWLLHEKCQKQLKEKGYIRGRGVKSRQQGWSTYSENRMLHGVVLNRNFNTLLIANDKETTELIFRIARFAYDSLNPAYKPLERYNSRREILLENPDSATRSFNPGLNSRMTFQQAKELSGTAGTIQGLHTDETAKWPPNACVMLENSLLPSLHLVPGTIHLDTSTAFVRGDYFREKCDDARSGKTSYFFQFVPWWLDPTYSIPLKRGEKFKPTAEEQRLIKLAAKGQGPPDDVPPHELTYEQLNWRRIVIADRIDGERLFQQEYPHCVVVGTRVGTGRGLLPIEEVRPGDITAHGAVTHSYNMGTARIYKATTRRGYSVKGPGTLPICTGEDFIRLADLTPGRHIALAQPMFAAQNYFLEWTDGWVKKNVCVDERFARFLGYFMGDGCLMVGKGNRGKGGVTVSICCDARDSDVIADVQDLLGTESKRAVGSKQGGCEVRKRDVSFLDLAQRLGIYSPTAPHRIVKVPECIWRSPKPVVREFLRGLFEADGSERGDRTIALFSKHRKFLEDIQLLLLGFGIEASVTTSRRRNRNGEYTANELTLYSQATDRFAEEIGFIGQRKRDKFKPPSTCGRKPPPQMFADEVVSVEDSGVIAPIWDLTMDDPRHVYDANGVIVHNTYEDAWVTMDINVFPLDALQRQRSNVCMPAHFAELKPSHANNYDRQTHVILRPPIDKVIDAEEDYCAIWRLPEKGHQYALGIDVALGIAGGNWTVFEVFDQRTREQVAEAHLHIDPDDAGWLAFTLGMFYNQAEINTELTGPGYNTDARLKKLQYPRLYIWRNR
jgi:hypothetical protein